MLREFDEQTPGGQGFEEQEKDKTFARGVFEWLRFLAILVLLGLLLRSLVISPFNIPSRSMTPTMQVGDYLFAAKWPYGYSRFSFPFAPSFVEGRWGGDRPERGDIVVFRSPADTNSDYVKRVIGLPGDRVRLVAGEIQLNGAIVPRSRVDDFREPINDAGDCPVEGATSLERGVGDTLFCRTPRYRETLPGGISYDVLDAGPTTADTTPEYTVPDGHYFLLGDDRDRSADSRFEPRAGGGIGFVPEENIVGEALIVFWSTDGTATWNPVSWFTAARWERIGRSF